MNELVISTYIQIMQNGLVEHSKQEAARRFILDSIAMQESALVMTDLNAKKISNTVNRKDPVPDGIKQASLKSDVAKAVYAYFEDNVIPDINPYTKNDVLQKLMNVIVQDVEIGEKQKPHFQQLYDGEKETEFLVETFLYSLQRNNKRIDDDVDYQDAPLLAEVNYECPLSHIKLIETVKSIPKKKYSITQIFPEGLSVQMAEEFNGIYERPADLDAPENLIALSIDESENYLIKPTVEEYKILYEIKQITHKRYKAINAINRIELEEEIRIVLDALMNLKPSEELPKLEYEALRIDEKIDDFILKNEVQNHVLSYYRYIESIFSDSTDSFDDIAAEIKLTSQKLEKTGFSQEEVISNLEEWIRNKTFAASNKGKLACRIVVSFFIQNCEVFYK